MSPRRIILDRDSGFWSARFANRPQEISAGRSPRAALAQLMAGSRLAVGRYRLSLVRERTDLAQGHAELLMQPPAWQSCGGCHGSGRHVQDTLTERCDQCAGVGTVPA